MSWQFQPLSDLFEQSPCWATSPSPAKEPKGLLYLSFSTEGNGWGAVDPLNLKHEYLIASLSQISPTLSHQELTAFRGREGNWVLCLHILIAQMRKLRLSQVCLFPQTGLCPELLPHQYVGQCTTPQRVTSAWVMEPVSQWPVFGQA